MWRKIGIAIVVVIGWGAIVAYIVYVSHLVRQHRLQQKVEKVEISLHAKGDRGQFATEEQILRRIENLGIKTEGEFIDDINIAGISKYLADEGYIRYANSYVTYSGKLYIDVEQHEPVLRLMCGGLNVYVTKEGDVFSPPRGSAYYAPVVTGKYVPIFIKGYEGNALDYFEELIVAEEDTLLEISSEMSALQAERKRCEKAEELAKLDTLEVKLKAREQAVAKSKKKLRKKSVDFVNLINFVSEVDNDPFWSAEIVQFVADTTYMGEISLRMIPRSGNFEIEFGTLDKSSEKLAKLQKFYDKGLPHVGWERYKLVDVRYDRQIICKE